MNIQDHVHICHSRYSTNAISPLLQSFTPTNFQLIASQALITATFSLVQQLINSKAFPPLRMLYTSETIQGQVYIPAVNWVLMIATVIFVVAFTDLTKLTNAYGFAVATVMFTTTCLIAIQIRYIKKLSVFISVGFFIIFGFFDGKTVSYIQWEQPLTRDF